MALKKTKKEDKPKAKVASKTDSAALPTGKRPPMSAAISKIESQYGKGSIQKAGEVSKIAFVPTGVIGLDALLGGGTPMGKIMEFYGPESSGKTTLATLMAASYQRKNDPVCFIDVEQVYDKGYAKDLGFDIDNEELAVFSQPDSAEEALDSLISFAESGSVGLSVLDSVAALAPQKELDGTMEEKSYALVAKLMAQALRKITGFANKNNNAIIFINQLREKIGIQFGNPETTTGGKSLKFGAAIRLDIRRIGQIKDGTETIGTEIKVKVIKNKVAPTAFAERTFRLYWGAGYDKIGDLISCAVEVGALNQKGAFFYNGEKNIGQGLSLATKTLISDEPLLREVLTNTVEAFIVRRKLPEAYRGQIDFVLEGMKGGLVSPLAGFSKPEKKSKEKKEEEETAVA